MDNVLAGRGPRTADPSSPGVPPWRKAAAASIDPPGARSHRLNVRHRGGELQFYLRREPAGLYVEREDVPKRGLRTWQALHFSGTGEFERWCDEDAVRFDHPQLYVTLKREGERLWQLDAAGTRG